MKIKASVYLYTLLSLIFCISGCKVTESTATESHKPHAISANSNFDKTPSTGILNQPIPVKLFNEYRSGKAHDIQRQLKQYASKQVKWSLDETCRNWRRHREFKDCEIDKIELQDCDDTNAARPTCHIYYTLRAVSDSK